MQRRPNRRAGGRAGGRAGAHVGLAPVAGCLLHRRIVVTERESVSWSSAAMQWRGAWQASGSVGPVALCTDRDGKLYIGMLELINHVRANLVIALTVASLDPPLPHSSPPPPLHAHCLVRAG
jgi:hypothetical protein